MKKEGFTAILLILVAIGTFHFPALNDVIKSR